MIDSYIQLMVLIHVDDTIIMSSTKEELQKVCDFCEKWKMMLSSGKTKVTMFGCRKAYISTFKFICNGEVCSWLKLTVEQQVTDQFIQKWQSELKSMSTRDLYVEFKQEFKLENPLFS